MFQIKAINWRMCVSGECLWLGFLPFMFTLRFVSHSWIIDCCVRSEKGLHNVFGLKYLLPLNHVTVWIHYCVLIATPQSEWIVIYSEYDVLHIYYSQWAISVDLLYLMNYFWNTFLWKCYLSNVSNWIPLLNYTAKYYSQAIIGTDRLLVVHHRWHVI